MTRGGKRLLKKFTQKWGKVRKKRVSIIEGHNCCCLEKQTLKESGVDDI